MSNVIPFKRRDKIPLTLEEKNLLQAFRMKPTETRAAVVRAFVEGGPHRPGKERQQAMAKLLRGLLETEVGATIHPLLSK